MGNSFQKLQKQMTLSKNQVKYTQTMSKKPNLGSPRIQYFLFLTIQNNPPENHYHINQFNIEL